MKRFQRLGLTSQCVMNIEYETGILSRHFKKLSNHYVTARHEPEKLLPY